MTLDTVTISRQEYEDLIDARDAAVISRAITDGAMPALTEADMDAYLASNPLAFWRKKRSLSQTSLARMAGISQPYLAQIEGGNRVGDVNLYAKLAKILRVRIEDLIAD